MKFLMLLAATTNPADNPTQVGTWVLIAIALMNGVGACISIFAMFATRRELEDVKQRVSKLEDADTAIRKSIAEATEKQIEIGEKRSTVLHNRINPLVENTAALKGAQEAFVASFNNFTEVIKSIVAEGKEQ